MDAAQFEAHLRKNGIPPRPAIIDIVGREMRKDSPDLRVLERALRSDVAIAAGLIQTVNSPYFGAQCRIGSILEALEMLGLRAAAEIVACVALRSAFPTPRLERFWDASVRIAELSAWLVGINRPGIRADDAYTFGLFRDCGIAVLFQRVPSYAELLKQANEEQVRPFTAVESAQLPLNHAQVGAMLAKDWGLGEAIVEAMRNHHDVHSMVTVGEVDSGDNPGALIAISQLAEYLFQQSTGLSDTEEWGKLGNACLLRLGMLDDDLPSLQRRAGEMLAAQP